MHESGEPVEVSVGSERLLCLVVHEGDDPHTAVVPDSSPPLF